MPGLSRIGFSMTQTFLRAHSAHSSVTVCVLLKAIKLKGQCTSVMWQASQRLCCKSGVLSEGWWKQCGPLPFCFFHVKRQPSSFFCLRSIKVPSWKQRKPSPDTKPTGISAANFPVSRTMRHRCLLFISYQAPAAFIIAAKPILRHLGRLQA